MSFPLNQCTDCVKRDNCELQNRLTSFMKDNKSIDFSETYCKEHKEDFVPDAKWKNISKVEPPVLETDPEEWSIPSSIDIIEFINDTIEDVAEESNMIPLGIIMSEYTASMLRRDGIVSKSLKHIYTDFGILDIELDKKAEPGQFGIKFISEEFEDEEDE